MVFQKLWASENLRQISQVSQCVVPENIHTPTTEGIGNSEGEGGGGSKTQEIPGGRGVV